MKKIYLSPALEILEMDLCDMLADSMTIEITDETTDAAEVRQLLIFSLTDD